MYDTKRQPIIFPKYWMKINYPQILIFFIKEIFQVGFSSIGLKWNILLRGYVQSKWTVWPDSLSSESVLECYNQTAITRSKWSPNLCFFSIEMLHHHVLGYACLLVYNILLEIEGNHKITNMLGQHTANNLSHLN